MAHWSRHAAYCPVKKAIDATPDMCGCGADEPQMREATDEEARDWINGWTSSTASKEFVETIDGLMVIEHEAAS